MITQPVTRREARLSAGFRKCCLDHDLDHDLARYEHHYWTI